MSQWIMWEVSGLFENIGTVQDGIGSISLPRLVEDRPGAATLEVAARRDRASSTSASTTASGKGVIDDLSLTVRPGEKVGLVGRSGAGKSTLVNLLLRFYDLESGRILIDGQDISAVTQDIAARPDRHGHARIPRCCTARCATTSSTAGPTPARRDDRGGAARRGARVHRGARRPTGRKGFDAHVGERGVKLSGGQRQRIAIARVMLKDAPILILDEATSALDSEVEAAIQENLYRLMEGKTVIAIAHRLSTIAAMDRLVVMDKGRIVEEGSHEALVAKRGLYAQLWARQSGGFLDPETAAEPILRPSRRPRRHGGRGMVRKTDLRPLYVSSVPRSRQAARPTRITTGVNSCGKLKLWPDRETPA